VHPVTKSLIDRTPERVRPVAVLALRTIDDSINDRVPGLAAEIAFYVLLSLAPLLLTILGIVGFVTDSLDAQVQADLVDRLVTVAEAVFAPEIAEGPIRRLLIDLLSEGRGDVAAIGFLATLFSASRAMRVLATAIRLAYDLEETRTAWNQRLWGLGLTLGGLAVSLLLVPFLVAGPRFGVTLAEWLPIDFGVAQVWAALYWPTALVVATALVASTYHLVAPWWTPWRRDLPGAALAVATWLAGTFGLRIYLAAQFDSESLYGQFSTLLAGLLWLWLTGGAILLGAEFNAEMERIWPSEHTKPGAPTG